MKLYNSAGPNPHVVRMFIAEKGIVVPLEQVDVLTGENRREPHLSRNPHGQTPVLELDKGQFVSEITAICEYIEDTNPTPPLIGSTPVEKAECRMWTRRIDLNICEPLTNGHRFSTGLAIFKERIVTVPEAADGLKRIAQDRLRWLEDQMREKPFVCGERFTLADILLYCFLSFGMARAQPLNAGFVNIAGWFERVGARPSAKV
jgi:glutathione S-transferase